MSQYSRNHPEEPVNHDWFAGGTRVKGQFRIGDKVTYLAHPGAKLEHGIVKSLHPDKKTMVFVVYKCAGNWDKFQDYTAALTDTESLEHGWLK